MTDEHQNSFWPGFLLGGALGAFLIVFLGTKRGKEIVEKIKDQSEELIEELEGKNLRQRFFSKNGKKLV